MKSFNYRFLGVGLAALLCMFTIQGCEEAAKQCGFVCAEVGIAGGNASITGVASIDGFLAAVVNFDTKANLVADGINAELAAIAASVDLEAEPDGSFDFAGKFQSNLQTKFNLDGGITVDYQEPRCEVSAKASIEATARCDVQVDPGSVKASCEGRCEVDPGSVDLEASCEGEATAEVTCTGTAPSLVCEGTCTGGCELEAGAKCEGSCKGGCSIDVSGECSGTCSGSCSGGCAVEISGECSGTCTGSCSGACQGTCSGTTDAGGVCDGECSGTCSGTCQGKCEVQGQANCQGSCSGTCQGKCELEGEASCDGECTGSCELEAGATCNGKCTGTCEWNNGDVACEGGAKMEVECKLEGSATPPKVNCDAECSGEVTPPSASAECEASAKAEAELNAECYPPSIAVDYSLTASGDVEADAAAALEFEAWLTGFKANLAAVVAAQAQADKVVLAGEGIIDAAGSAVANAAAEIDLEGDPAAAFKVASCLPAELSAVPAVIADAGASLEASVSGSLSLLAALGQ